MTEPPRFQIENHSLHHSNLNDHLDLNQPQKRLIMKNGTQKWINSETRKLFKCNSRMETNTETIRTSQDEETLYLRDRQSNTCLTDLTGDQTFNSKPLSSTTKPRRFH